MALCPPALQASGSRDIFYYVVTPERIPQFVIPPLDVHKKQRCSGKGTGEERGQLEGTAWRSSWDPAVRDEHGSNSSSFNPSSFNSSSFNPSSFNSSSFNSSSFNPSCSTPDPTAWAALSLPHLPKVTTPYGFVTLARSPQVTREEAFFHSGPCCRHLGIPAAEGDSSMGGSQRDHKQPSHKDDGSSLTPAGLPLPRCARDIQKTEALERQEAGRRDRRLLGKDCSRSSSLELPVVTARKNLFQRILRRHLGHPRQLKPGYFTLH